MQESILVELGSGYPVCLEDGIALGLAGSVLLGFNKIMHRHLIEPGRLSPRPSA